MTFVGEFPVLYSTLYKNHRFLCCDTVSKILYLCDNVGIGRNLMPGYLLFIEEAGMITQLRDDTGGIRGLGKVDKVYLDNTNLAALSL